MAREPPTAWSLRAAVAGLIVLATIGFVVGTAIERHSKESGRETPATARSESGEHSETARAGEGGEKGGGEHHAELKPLGIDIEAAPFVALAAIASLILAAGVWVRPTSLAVLGLVAVVMVLFAALDVREIFHQVDESRTGLAVLAGVVAALHLAAATGCGLLARRGEGPLGSAATM